MIYEAEKYSKPDYTMPDRENKKIKDKDGKNYNLAMAKAIYSAYCGGRSYGGYDLYNKIDEYRSYALGKQNQERYRDAFYGKSASGVITPIGGEEERVLKRKGFASLNFDIMSPMTLVLDALRGKIRPLTDMVSVDPVDSYSTNLKEDIKWGTYVDGRYQNLFRSLRALGGLPQQELGYVPKNVEELNLFEAEGGFKLAYAETQEELVKTVFDQSRWEDNAQDRVIDDLVTVGFAVAEDVFDPTTGQVLVEYRDVKFAGVQYCREDSYSKPDWGFVVRMTKLSELRMRGFEEDQLMGLGKRFAEKFGNPSSDDWAASNKSGGMYSRDYDDYLVPVLKIYWIDVEYKNEVEHINRHGVKRVYDYQDQKLGNKDKLIETRTKTLREASWIVDTEMIYDYGKVKNQPRDGFAHPVLPIHMVKVSGSPIVPRVIPALDLYMNSWMKFQQGIRLAALNGFTINMDAISNLSLGNKKLDPRDIIKMWRETGIMFVKQTDYMGRVTTTTRPVESLPGGAGPMLKEALDGMTISVNIIEQITGINPIVLGQTPSERQGKALTEYSLGATESILSNIVRPANILKQNVARNVCIRLQQVVRSNKKARELYSNIIGDTRMQLLIDAEGHDVRYGITTKVRPTDQEKQMLIEMITTSLKNGRDGKVGITEADATRFLSLINSGHSLKRVSLLLQFAIEKAQETAEARAMRAQQMESQKNQQLEVLKAQIANEQETSKTRLMITETEAKLRADILLKAYEVGDLAYADLEKMLNLMKKATQQPPVQEQQPAAPQGEGMPM